MIQEAKKKKEPEDDMVTRIQKYAKGESDKKAAEEAAKKKKKGTVDTAPSKGILSRIYEFATGVKEPEDKKKK